MRQKKKDYLVFDVLVGEGFEADGEKRTSWTPVATVFRDQASGKISGKVKEGLALTGRFIIRARDQQPSERSRSKVSGPDLLGE